MNASYAARFAACIFLVIVGTVALASPSLGAAIIL